MVPARPEHVTFARRSVAKNRQRRRRYRRYWRSPVVDGAYAKLPVWTSRERWLDTVDTLALEHADWTPKRRSTLHAIAEVLAAHADGTTGRGVTVSNKTVAATLNIRVRTVQRHLSDLEDLGLLATVDGGRHLTRDERIRAYEETERVLWRKTSTRALMIPRAAANRENVTPPTASAVGMNVPVVDGTNARSARAKKPRTSTPPRPLSLQRLAAGIAHRLGWLVRARHIGALCDALSACLPDPSQWQPNDVIRAIDTWHQGQRRTSIAQAATNRLGWFVWALRSALDAGATPAPHRSPSRLQPPADPVETTPFPGGSAAARAEVMRRAALAPIAWAQRSGSQAGPVRRVTARVEASPAAHEAVRIARSYSRAAAALRVAREQRASMVSA